MTARASKTVGIIGCGLIGMNVIRAVDRGEVSGWSLGPVLANSARTVAGVAVGDDLDAFLANPLDLVIEAGGPGALAAHGARVLAQSNLWTVSAAALADDELTGHLQDVGAEHGHHLRVVAGAIGGLDGLAATTVAPDAELIVEVDLVPSGPTSEEVFRGTARAAASRFPNHVNVAVAAALAGPGLDATTVIVRQPKAGEPHTLRIRTTGRDGSMDATTYPIVRPGPPGEGIHIVASSLIAALAADTSTIRVG